MGVITIEEYRASAPINYTLVETLQAQIAGGSTYGFFNQFEDLENATTDPTYYLFSAEDIDGTAYNFLNRSFDVRLATSNTSGQMQYQLAIDDSDGYVYEALKAVDRNTKIEMVYRTYFLGDPIPKEQHSFHLDSIGYSERTVSGTGTVAHIQRRNFPANVYKYTTAVYPAI